MSVFGSLGKNIEHFIAKQGMSIPTPIQEKAIPTILESDYHTLLLSPTGSGKTEAALLPLLFKLSEKKALGELFGFYILYMTPLRALNRDVFKRIEALCDHLDLTVAVRHGDTTQYARRKQALKPPNLLVTTPETLQAILPGKRLRYHLMTVFAVVVDEIHELADSKRGTQLSLGLERLERIASSSIQRIGLSATVGNPDEVASLLGGVGRSVKTLWAGYDSREMNLRVEMPIPDKTHTELGRRISYPPHSTARLEHIIDLVNSHTSTLVFTNTRSFAEILGSKMMALKPSYEFDVHHGSLSKDVRLDAEDRLKRGISRAIIATSSLELGIDIGQADLVIQYSSPREVARALQRTGRAGHGVGQVSEGVIMTTVNLDDVTESGVILRRARANKVEDAKIPRKSWDVLCQQISGVLLDSKEMNKTDLLQFVSTAYPFRETTEEELDSILDFMAGRSIIKRDGEKILQYKRTRVFYYDHLSTIPDVRQVKAVDLATRTSIGVLDEDYVLQNVEPGSVFVIRGRPWNVVTIDEESGEVLCAPAAGTEIEAPRWIGEMIPVPYNVATEVAKVWKMVADDETDNAGALLSKEYGISNIAQEHVISIVHAAADVLGMIPTQSSIVIEDFESGLVIHAPFGTKVNESLGIVIAALLTTRTGSEVGVERDPYRILLTSNKRIDPNQVADVLGEYDGKQISSILRLAVKRTQSFGSRFVHVARRMDVIRRDAKLREIPVRRLIKSFQETPVFEEAMREVLEDKLDEKRVIEIFEGASSGKLTVHIVKADKPSALARLIVEEKTRFEVMGEITDENEVLRMVEDRLMSKKFRLICLGNGDWNSVRTVSTLDDEISCPVCGSKVIAALFPTDKDFTKIVNKRVSGKKLTREEEKQYRAGTLIAGLVSRYGKRALLVLAGRGIGATNASRILHPGLTDRQSLLRAVAKAEMEYARTRPFWK
ncbi:MAG: DEAD/DEAH box helicase [Candidatus Thorarchaeota archaeon]|jgi:ATP-dependent Lhr-like helicase